jgi:hypothetical protein
MQREAVRVLVSAAAAVGLTFLAYLARPSGLDVQTDIVGYPTFANFDIDRYYWNYGLLVVFLPVVTIGLYALLTRLVVGRLGPWRPLPALLARIEEIPSIDGWRTSAVTAGRALFVGGVLGLEVAVALGRGWELMVATGVVYAAAVMSAGWLVSQVRPHDRSAAISVLNTLATPFLVAGLWGLSRSTEVEVASSGEVHRYRWLPAWIAVAGAIALLLVLVRALRRRHGRAAIQRLERTAVLLVVAPVALFVFMAALPGELGTFDSYEEGQAVAGAELVRDGSLPWRDLMVSHGLLNDVVRGVLGFTVFDESRWGMVAADEVLLVPLAWVALYYLCSYLFWTNWLFLLGSQLLVVTGVVTTIETRLILVPLVLLLLAALLARPTVPRAVAFTFVLAVQLIVTPEALVVGAAALATLAAFEFAYRRKDVPVTTSYRRMSLCLASALGLALAWALFLAIFDALGDWAFGLASVVPGHRLTGGIPFLVEKTEFEVFAPVAGVLVVYAFVAARVRSRLAFAYRDWLMVAMGLLTMLYFAKFLSRADPHHLAQSFAVAVPLLFYVAFRGITYAEMFLVRQARGRGLAWFPRRHTLTLPLLLVALIAAPEPLYDAVDAAPAHFTARVGQEPDVPGIGYARPGENDAGVLASLADAIDDLAEPGDTVFDFSNAPGILHYLLGRQPSTRYYHVSFAIRKRTQSDLVDHLVASPAGVVVLTSDGAFNSLPAWDGVANQVRHYDVSEYVLDHYVPVQAVDGFVLMVPRTGGAAIDPELYFHVDSCDWGYVPNFFADGPSRNAQSVKLPMRRSEDGKRFVVTLPPDAAAYRWLELRSGAPFADGRFELTDRPGGDVKRSIAFKALDRGESTLRVMVGACTQWRGYRPGVVYLTSSETQDVDSVRLVR